MNKIKLIIILGVGICLGSCKKSTLILYEDVARVQFGPVERLLYSQTNAFQDSLKLHTFAYLDNTKLTDTAYFDIYTMGDISNKDRSFTLKQEQVAGEENAVPGVHYKGFDNTDVSNLYQIKAGQMHSLVPIILLRDASLKESSVVLKIALVENENFQKGQENLSWRKLSFTDKLNRPANWNPGMLGKYSEVKHRFMISATNEKWDQGFILSLMRDVQAQHYWLGKVKSALLKYNNEHPNDPLKDEENEVIILP